MKRWMLFTRRVSLLLLIFSGVTLAFMLVFTVTNITMRFFGRPMVGDFEIISFLGSIVIGFALPYTTMSKSHVAVDMVIEKVTKKTGERLQIFTRVVCLALFLWMAWNFITMSLDMIRVGEVTQVFRIPYYPITFGLAFCCLIQCFVFILQIQEIAGERHE
ncbi:MAG: TRAP transporter small permease [Deltaproteobacteria bacterium]|nr:TRAP transporter small permease [Deltaproteobacteria bacterium]